MILNKRLLKIEKLLKKQNKGRLFQSFIVITSDGIYKAKDKMIFLWGDKDFIKVDSIDSSSLKVYEYKDYKIEDLFFINRPDGAYPIIGV
ncbi:MAG: hypothetical protein RSB41_03815 [Bacilli bacterium]